MRVLTAAGPKPARSMVALLGLAPFVVGGVDWEARPNPPMDNVPFRYFFEKGLHETGERWESLYSEENNPTLKDTALFQALHSLRQLAAEHPDGTCPSKRSL